MWNRKGYITCQHTFDTNYEIPPQKTIWYKNVGNLYHQFSFLLHETVN